MDNENTFEAEKGLVGSILIDDSCIYDVYNLVKPDMFSNSTLRDVYGEILAMYDIGMKITVIELVQRCDGKIQCENLANFLVECMGVSEGSFKATSYANVIVTANKCRLLNQLFVKTPIEAKSIDGTIADLIARLEELQQSKSRRSKSLKEIVEENKDNYFRPTVSKSIRLGFEQLDTCLGGLEAGDVTVVGARPSVGKSAFVTQIIAQVASQGYRVGYFNLEMNESQVYERMLSHAGQLSLLRIRKSDAFLNDEEQRFERANKYLSEYDIVVSSGSKTVGEIKAESRHQKFDLIVIDYLQIILSDKSYGNRVSEVGYISKAIKGLAMELKIPIILLSQLSRAVEQRDDKEPNMADLRESGDIEQDASNIIFLWNLTDDENCNQKGVKVDKNRQGVKVKYGMNFEGNKMSFVESTIPFNDFKRDAKARSGFRDTSEDETAFSGRGNA